MAYRIEEWLIAPLPGRPAPEFRTANHTFGAAYSGPEQRWHVRYRLLKDPARRAEASSLTRTGTSLAA